LEKFIHAKAKAKEIESAERQVAAALDPLIAGLKAMLNSAAAEAPAPAPASAPVDPVQSREAAVQLMKLLSEFDPGAADFIETNRAALQPLFADGTWTPFEKLVQGYAFADAQTQLDQALKNFPAA
jgi:hypothetical protein